MKKIQRLFGDMSDDSSFRQLYVKEILIPAHLDYQRFKLLGMSEFELRALAEQIRLHLLNLWEKGHGLFSTNLSQDGICSAIKDLINYPVEKELRHLMAKYTLTIQQI
ncbi:MAG: hypothetical protein NT007_01155 [Candidatus Kapabacteria bacterium]|nr:hypothetical protein [Candidatus Kapabacteria bacterium]